MKILLLLVFASLAACSPAPHPTPTPEPADAAASDTAPEPLNCTTPANCACARLCWLNCPECDPSCEPSVEKILVDRTIKFDTTCVANAMTKEAVRTCPSVTCDEN